MNTEKKTGVFVWDIRKEKNNIQKHQIDFMEARKAFFDEDRIITVDEKHSEKENRYFCIGKVGRRIITVRFTYREGLIRIYGAGVWRKGKLLYEQKN